MTRFFTADTHLGHVNILKYCDRSFSSVDEMDEVLIENWNSVVDHVDTVHHLGDLTLRGYFEFIKYVSQLKGSINFIPGGHDHRWLKEFSLYADTIRSNSNIPIKILSPLVSLKIPELSDTKHPQIIVLCHYAMRVWDRSHYGAYHLYGHSHGNLPSVGRSMDVGVDTNGFFPYSLDEVHKKLKDIPIACNDHFIE